MMDQSGSGAPAWPLAASTGAPDCKARATASAVASTRLRGLSNGPARRTRTGTGSRSCQRRARNRSQFRVAASRGRKTGRTTIVPAFACRHASNAWGSDGPPCSRRATSTSHCGHALRRRCARLVNSSAGRAGVQAPSSNQDHSYRLPLGRGERAAWIRR